jgi:hypothetical protein
MSAWRQAVILLRRGLFLGRSDPRPAMALRITLPPGDLDGCLMRSRRRSGHEGCLYCPLGPFSPQGVGPLEFWSLDGRYRF